jgi:hypothetical protein
MTELKASRTLVKSPPELWAECSDAASLARHLGQFGEIRITRLDPETAVAWEGERARGTVRIEPAGWGTRVTLTAVTAEEPAPAVVPAAEEPAPVVDSPADGPGTTDEPEAAAEPVPPPPEPGGAADQVSSAEPGGAADQVPCAELGGAADQVPSAELGGAADQVPSPEPGGAPDQVPADHPAAPERPTPRRRFARVRAFFRGRPDEPDVGLAEVPEPEPPAPEPPAPDPEPPVPEPAPEPPLPHAIEATLSAALDSLGRAHHRPYSRA